MKDRAYTGRSVALGLATGTVVSVMLGALGIDWVLACMTGLTPGAFALPLRHRKSTPCPEYS